MRNIIGLFMIVIVLVFSGCSQSREFPTIEEKKPYAQELTEWLPSDGVVSRYTGAYDYLHTEEVRRIESNIYERVYSFYGEVSSNTITPSTFTSRVVLDNLSAVRYLEGYGISDDKFVELTLLKLPLEKGHTWTENVKDAYGNTYTIESEILSLTEYDNKRYLEIKYSDQGSDYYEVRRFESGTGVVYCEVHMMFGDASIDLIYDFEQEYVPQEKMTIERNEQEDVPEQVRNNATIQERESITALIQDFNDAWILYINEDDLRVYEYLKPGEPAYISVKTFNKEGLKERFIFMDVEEIEVDGDVAYVNVHEEIEHIRGDDVIVVNYDWIYEVRWYNDILLIVNYYER